MHRVGAQGVQVMADQVGTAVESVAGPARVGLLVAKAEVAEAQEGREVDLVEYLLDLQALQAPPDHQDPQDYQDSLVSQVQVAPVEQGVLVEQVV